MADLIPIQTETGEPVRYAERDPIGVESAEATHRRGANAEIGLARAAYDRQTLEHDENGVHDTPKIARAFVEIRWGGVDYHEQASCYLLGTTGTVPIAVSRTSAGRVKVTFGTSLGTTNIGTQDCTVTQSEIPSTTTPTIVRVQLETVIAANQIEVVRREGEDYASLTPTDGDLAFLVFAE